MSTQQELKSSNMSVASQTRMKTDSILDIIIDVNDLTFLEIFAEDALDIQISSEKIESSILLLFVKIKYEKQLQCC